MVKTGFSRKNTRMKLVQFLLANDSKSDGQERVGVLLDENTVLDLTSALGIKSVIDFIRANEAFFESTQK